MHFHHTTVILNTSSYLQSAHIGQRLSRDGNTYQRCSDNPWNIQMKRYKQSEYNTQTTTVRRIISTSKQEKQHQFKRATTTTAASPTRRYFRSYCRRNNYQQPSFVQKQENVVYSHVIYNHQLRFQYHFIHNYFFKLQKFD